MQRVMSIRTGKVMKILNISLETIIEYLNNETGLEPTKKLNYSTKLTDLQYEALLREFSTDKHAIEKNRESQSKTKKQ